MDLSKFFDRVNHDRLMSRIASRIEDKRVLKLIRRYLQCGVMIEGVAVRSEEGTPQGGPLSPLLSNIVLDELDKELKSGGLRFVRYADDFMIYCKSLRSAERVKRSITVYLSQKLKLKVNQDKSAVSRPWLRKFLGFSYFHMYGQSKVRIHAKSLERFKCRVRELTSRKSCLETMEEPQNQGRKPEEAWNCSHRCHALWQRPQEVLAYEQHQMGCLCHATTIFHRPGINPTGILIS